MEQTKYTVFYDDGGYQHNEEEQEEFSGVGVCEIIALGLTRWPNCTPVAWACEWPGKRGMQAIRAESIAAGRVIELVDGQYVPRGVPVPSTTPTLDKLENEADPEMNAWFDAMEQGCNAAMIARDGQGVSSYRARAFRDGQWLPWHDITEQVYENRKRWPRDGYEVQAAPFADEVQAQPAAKPALASLSRISSMSHMLGNGIGDEVR